MDFGKLEVARIDGITLYNIQTIIAEFVYLEEKTLLGEPLRFNTRECRMELLSEGRWDVYISEDYIIDYAIV